MGHERGLDEALKTFVMETLQLSKPLMAVKTGTAEIVWLPLGSAVEIMRESGALAGIVEIAYDGDQYSVSEENLRQCSCGKGRLSR
jgi:hypothetical protein